MAKQMKSSKMCNGWTKWMSFPNPNHGEYLNAPFGAGVYELRNKNDEKLVLFGISKNVAKRMTSLLNQEKGGSGGRNNKEKIEYISNFIENIQYRTLATKTKSEAEEIERKLKLSKNHIFKT